MIWTEELIETLRGLWASGASTNAIGIQMGVSKNAIVGKAHRLDLDGRPSPIRPAGSGRPVMPSPAAKTTLPPLGSLFQTVAVAQRKGREPTTSADDDARIRQMHSNGMGYRKIARQVGVSDDIVRRVLGVRSEPRPPSVLPPMPAAAVLTPPKPVIEAPARAEAPRSPRPVRECCWPIGEPRTKAFRFCGGAAVLGKPYCEGHCRDGYTKIRDREQAA